MSWNSNSVLASPPLRNVWRSETGFSVAVPGSNTLYGIKPSGRLAALQASDGAQRWETTGTYLPNRLVQQGNRLFAFKLREGLAYIDDNGTSASEFLAISFGATPEANIATPVLDGRRIYVAVNQGLYAVHQDDGLQYVLVLTGPQPYSAGLVGDRSVVVIDGRGVPSRYHAGDTAFELTWTGQPHGLNVGLEERPFVIAGNRLILGLGNYTVAYNLTNGSVAWVLANVPSRAFAVQGDFVYAAFHGAALWAIRLSNGTVAWHRQHIYDTSLQGPYGLVMAGGYLYFGGNLRNNPDTAVTLAFKPEDGSFAWVSRAVALPWAGGVPVTDGEQLYVYGAGHAGAYAALQTSAQLGTQLIDVSPRPLRGPASGFGAGRVRVNMPVSARVSIAPWREAQGLGSVAVNRANWGTGLHEVSWSVAGTGGFSATSQFGYLLVDVEEGSGVSYTQGVLMPVNAFPDIMGHWAQESIEIMVYRQYVSGYPDQTFKPDNLVTRAESCTIIAKTLGLTGPSPSFRTKFTDIGAHWARDFIMALEERGVIGGFAEPDGTFTFRPDLNMTRGQEARILVNAYSIPGAPAGFHSHFTDITGHWAAPDISALEAAGFVQGFQGPDGTFTYRPEQNLTRAEMCTIIVRIRNLTR